MLRRKSRRRRLARIPEARNDEGFHWRSLLRIHRILSLDRHHGGSKILTADGGVGAVSLVVLLRSVKFVKADGTMFSSSVCELH